MANQNNGRTQRDDDRTGRSSYNPSFEGDEHGYQDARDNQHDRYARGRGDDRSRNNNERYGMDRDEHGRDFSDYRRGSGYGYDDMSARDQGRDMMNYRRDDHDYRGQSGAQAGGQNNNRSWGNEGGNRGAWGEFDRGGRWSPSSHYGNYDTQSPSYGRNEPYGQHGGYGQGQYDMQNHWRDQGERWSAGSQGGQMGNRDMNRGGYGFEGQSGYTGGQYVSGRDNIGHSGNFRAGGFERSDVGQGRGQQGSVGGESAGYGYRSDLDWRSTGSQGYGQQQSQRGPHSGKGPQGYVRSDDRIKEIVNDALTEHGHVDASNITVEVKNGEVTLSGHVDDRSTKRLAEDIAASCSGVKDVINHIRVGQDQKDQMPSGTTAQAGANNNTRKSQQPS